MRQMGRRQRRGRDSRRRISNKHNAHTLTRVTSYHQLPTPNHNPQPISRSCQKRNKSGGDRIPGLEGPTLGLRTMLNKNVWPTTQLQYSLTLCDGATYNDSMLFKLCRKNVRTHFPLFLRVRYLPMIGLLLKAQSRHRYPIRTD